MLDHRLDARSASCVVGLLTRRSPMVLLFDSLGGQVAQIGTGDTAFPHRRALASIQVYSGSAGGDRAVHAVQQELASLVGRGAYVNYLNADQSDWAQASYAANLPRLRTVVRRHDPHGVFAFPQSVLHA
jgi:hypothetical protein